MKLTIQPATPVLRPLSDGTGFELCREGEYRASLTIGNVSVAFDGRNNRRGIGRYGGNQLDLSEYADDPVRLDGDSVADRDQPLGQADSAVSLLHALAADLGYTVTRND